MQPARKITSRADAVSVTGNRWQLKPEQTALSDGNRLPPSATRIIARRGIEPEAVEAFLNPTRENSMPAPPYDKMRRMSKAVERITKAMHRGEKIAVLGDYDVDGCTGTAILERFFHAVGVDVTTYIPHRIHEGYGPNIEAIRKLHAQGVKLLITVDCGTTAYAPLEEAARLGMDVIVTDHHKTDAGPEFPANTWVVNPNRPDDHSRLKYLTGAGVAYLLCERLYSRLDKPVKDEELWFTNHLKPKHEELFEPLTVLAALGTHCDVAPIEGFNRWLMKEGLAVTNQWRDEVNKGERKEWPIPGLRALAEASDLKGQRITEDHFGFQLGPRINAGGRVAPVSHLGKDILTTNETGEAIGLARELDHFNIMRKDIQKSILQEAMRQAEAQAADQPIIFVSHKGWHEGVIGIVAGQLKETFGKPAFVVTVDDEGHAKGSARSIEGVDIGDAVIKAVRLEKLLSKGGGHAMAAGFSLDETHLTAFHAYLNHTLGEAVAKASEKKRLKVDDIIAVKDLTPALASSYEKLGPFGRKNEPPRVVMKNVHIVESRVVGRNHDTLQLTLSDAAHPKERARAVLFKKAGQPLGLALRHPYPGEILQLAGKPTLGHFQGEPQVQFEVEDSYSGPLQDILNQPQASAIARLKARHSPITRITR